VAAGALSCLLGLALMLEAAQAGRTYVYCLAMREVMSGPCCRSAAEASDEFSKIAATAPECCELRVAQALAPSAPAARGAVVEAAFVALPATLSGLSAGAQRGVAPEPVAAMRTGPPPARARARLMVFLI
jgi:hypothetical protein